MHLLVYFHVKGVQFVTTTGMTSLSYWSWCTNGVYDWLAHTSEETMHTDALENISDTLEDKRHEW